MCLKKIKKIKIIYKQAKEISPLGSISNLKNEFCILLVFI